MWVVLWIGIGALLMLATIVALVLLSARANRAAIARAEIGARQRRAEAQVQQVVQDTIQQMLDAARRSQ
jgi:hypothetical protein